MWELDHKEGWASENWCFWIMMLEKTLESPLESKEIKPVNPKGNQSWIFIGRTDAEAPTLWPPDVKSRLTGKYPDAGKVGGQEEKDRGWHGWILSPTQWMWVWANFGRQWRSGEPGMLQSMRWQSQTQLSDWTTTFNTSNIELVLVNRNSYCMNVSYPSGFHFLPHCVVVS